MHSWISFVMWWTPSWALCKEGQVGKGDTLKTELWSCCSDDSGPMCQGLCAPRIQLFQYEERNSCLIYFEELVLFLRVNLYWINPQLAFHNASLVHFHYFQWKWACKTFPWCILQMFQFSWLTDYLGKTECSKPSYQHTDHRVPNTESWTRIKMELQTTDSVANNHLCFNRCLFRLRLKNKNL